MRLVADMVRGMEVQQAMYLLQHSPKHASRDLVKLLTSAIANWEQKNDKKVQDEVLVVKEIQVDSGRVLKRLQTAPQGRAHRIRKRSNHITLIVGEAHVEVPVVEEETVEQS
jgi:large subunit ribosomal protein L22